ncbi:MAG: hypothetical protein GX786_04640, partial [Clostridiales bacterium]|nr:hypothetical protein [Clostridiales bacterium]
MGDNQATFEYRLERMEKTLESIDEKVSNLNLIDHRVKALEKGHGELNKRLCNIEQQSGRSYDAIKKAVITAIISALFGG